MTNHYILSINPEAEYAWNRCVLSHPITAHRPEFAQVIAEAVGEEEGTYLVSVKIEVQVLEKVLEEMDLAPVLPKHREVGHGRSPLAA